MRLCWIAFAQDGCIESRLDFTRFVEVGHISEVNRLRQIFQRARITRQNSVGWHVVPTFAHTLLHAGQKAPRVVQCHHVERHHQAMVNSLFNQCQLGCM